MDTRDEKRGFRQPCADDFEPEFENALKQAAAVSLVNLPGLGEDGGMRWLLILARAAFITAPGGYECTVDGLRRGVEIVAYDCEPCGRVTNEERRFRSRGLDCDGAVRLLHMQIANGMATLEAPDAEEIYLPDLIGNERTDYSRTSYDDND